MLKSTMLFSFLVLICNFANGYTDTPFDEDLKTGKHFHFLVKDHYLSDKYSKEIQYQIDYTRWLPDHGNGHTIVYLHGLQSHRGWFYSTAEILRKMGYTLYAFDRAGSGTSQSALAQNGWPFGLEDIFTFLPGVTLEPKRSHAASYALHLDTINKMLDIVEEEDATSKIHLWGNSYAAKIVSRFLQNTENATRVTSSIFTTPGLYRNNTSMPLPFSKFDLIAGYNSDSFPSPVTNINGDNGASWFTSMANWSQKIKNDPLSNRTMTREMALQTRKMDEDVERDTQALNGIKRFYLMVNGDSMMDNDRIVEAIKSAPTGAIYKFYSGGDDHKHFLTFTVDRDQALQDIHRFLIPGATNITRAITYEN